MWYGWRMRRVTTPLCAHMVHPQNRYPRRRSDPLERRGDVTNLGARSCLVTAAPATVDPPVAHAYDYAVCDWRVLVRSCGSSCAWDSAPKLVTSVRRSVPTARHASSVEGVRRARPLHGHGASRADHPRRTVQLGAAISALEWVAHVTHSPRFDERLMLLRLASSNTCPAEFSCSMHAARSEWITSIRPVTGLCPRELAGAVDHVPCEHQLCAAACQTVQRTVLWCHAHRGRRPSDAES